ncbi:CAP domain-containing protein [Thalassobacillus sp. CUG 92003]|uniref:CAP domain-containing protein n=1 Tax=Thalassobacillus sp. CUG 92003 TaxID=2736641 RepID=UPI0015E74ABE|nr:CAP domain-containing protein [Thalassobacillus sp. CUG 92003]
MRKLLYMPLFALIMVLVACNQGDQEGMQGDDMTYDRVNYGQGEGERGNRGYEGIYGGQRDFNMDLWGRKSQEYAERNQEGNNGFIPDAGQNNTKQEAQNQTPTESNSEGPVGNDKESNDQSLSNLQTQVIELTNAEREKQGLDPLKASKEVSKVAQAKSKDMAKNDYFSHTSPTYGSPFDMLKDFGVDYTVAAENIAAGQQTPEEVVKGWMNSPGHRKNIMNRSVTHIGVGYAKEGNHWTQMFIGK